ncbi:MAG: hypothetical protein K9J16_19105 [Melioribacteraceae bacterium]|nr:hypothetical protein [Melioribacteraceae bacterium]MCF8357041.1 hypothetical protein [Melioribacteraceae bacterium]MCF8396484.1 hypothetical protein [Melioribacteraceae bacterium]
MPELSVLQIIGYIGSLLIAISLTMTNILKLRWINLAGASTFAFYGLLIGAYPVFILNGFITAVDVYYLIQMYNRKEYFRLVPADGVKDLYLKEFLNFYKDDIIKFFPEFDLEKFKDAKVYFILRDMNTAGLFIFKEITESKIRILLDYATPDYRDLDNARFIFYTTNFMNKKGYTEAVTESHHKLHDNYLKKLGFEKTGEQTFKKIF